MTISKNDAAKAAAMEAAAKAKADEAAAKEAARVATFGRFESLGATFKQAKGAITSAGYVFNAAARAGILSQGDAKAVWERFAKGANEAPATDVLLGNETVAVVASVLNPGDASQVSKFKAFARPQILHMGLGWFERIARIHAPIWNDGKAKQSLFNSIYAATNHFCDEAEKALMTDAQIADGKFDVTDEALAALFTKAAKAGEDDKPAKLSDEERAEKALAALHKASKSGRIVGLSDLVQQVKACLGHHETTRKLGSEEKRKADQKAGYLAADELVKLVA